MDKSKEAKAATSVPAFYSHPETVNDMIDNLIGRALARMGIEKDLFEEWGRYGK